jgi:hypothetical protein
LPNLQDIRLPPTLPTLAHQYDPELNAWFDGTPYRTDILQAIDQEVGLIAGKIRRRVTVTYRERKLISYCVWGNLVDAFKCFEYSYQEIWLPHRYLPEHGESLDQKKASAASRTLTETISHAPGDPKAAQIL